MAKKKFVPSPYQQAIFDWVESHRAQSGSLIIEAVAGSGKTTTIAEAAELIPKGDRSVFLAFNKSIANELKERLPSHVYAKTLNSLGWGAVGKSFGLRTSIKLDKNKTMGLIRRHLPDEAQMFAPELASIIGKAKSHALVPDVKDFTGYEATRDRWLALIDRYEIDTPEDWVEFVEWCDILLMEGLRDISVCDFDDQMYLVVAMDLPCGLHDWIIVDEAQDVSHVQRHMLKKFLAPGGRLIAVGDSHQAIYGFRGADSDSLLNLERTFGSTRLPLSLTYRCPKAVVAAAQEYVPHIQCPDSAPDGTVRHVDSWDAAWFNSDDLIICRNSAPVITLAYHCIGEGVPVRVAGRDIGQGLVNLVRKIAGRRVKTIDSFIPKLDAWSERETRKANAAEKDTKAQSIQDRVASIKAVINFAEPQEVGDLINAIMSLFKEGGSDGPTLSTIHKAKGLEADRVFILEPSLVPSPWAKQDWQVEQERNLAYVAITRARDELIYLPLSAMGAVE